MPNNTNLTYGYDADGRRVKQTVGSTVTNSQWDEASTYGDVVNEYNSSGTLASYVLGNTGLISQTRGTTTNYFLQDGQGSTRALTSSSSPATVTDTYSYTAFGDIFSRTGTTTNPYQYTGQQFDSLTGLYDLRARYYNPALGRFLSQDTYLVNRSNLVELNRYVYTGNNPINGFDPTGHNTEEYGIAIGFGVEVGVGVEVFVWDEELLNLYLFPGGGMGLFGALSAPVRIILASILLASVAGPAIAPQVYVSPQTQTTETQPEKPIALDLGPSVETREILPLIAYYKTQGIKVVAIENNPDAFLALKALEASMPDDFGLLQGSYTDSSILSSHGYGCAVAAFSLWPGADYGGKSQEGYAGIPTAINNLVCSGGYVHIITEIQPRFQFIANGLAGTVETRFISPPTVSPECIINPLSPKCSNYGSASIPVSFNSTHNESENYVLIGNKR